MEAWSGVRPERWPPGLFATYTGRLKTEGNPVVLEALKETDGVCSDSAHCVAEFEERSEARNVPESFYKQFASMFSVRGAFDVTRSRIFAAHYLQRTFQSAKSADAEAKALKLLLVLKR